MRPRLARHPHAPLRATTVAGARDRNALRDPRNAAAAWHQRIAAVAVMATAAIASDLAHAQPAAAAMPSAPSIAAPADMPPQKGRVFVVAGGSSGTGFDHARALAASGARVVIVARDAGHGHDAVARILADWPGAELQLEPVDLADLDAVRALAARLRRSLPRIDGLIGNAEVVLRQQDDAVALHAADREDPPDAFVPQPVASDAGYGVLMSELLPLLAGTAHPVGAR